jgi:hydroxymethylpyrimidine pyrophosphatase-like HAD family hydrolase
MRYVALATDYDGTLAHDGRVNDETLQALEQLRLSGRKLILVTGRQLDDLNTCFPHPELFERIVAENGAVVYSPQTREKQVVTEPPNPELIAELRKRGVPFDAGDAIVATWRPHETTVLEAIRDLGLELHVIFNKGAVMILPATVNKTTGLKAALKSLGISEHNVAAIGDAENDHAFLKWCEMSAAVANALPALKETADIVMKSDHGAGVVELIHMMLEDDLACCSPKRRAIEIGSSGDARVTVPAYGSSVLVAGGSGSGKSTFVTAFIECLIEQKYQVCLIDPEGDYDDFPGVITIGDEKHAPSVHQILQGLEKRSEQIVANFLAIPFDDRPGFFASLAPRLEELRMRNGRPHWIVIDEAHHMLPPEWAPGSAELAGDLKNLVLITIHPDHVSPAALKAVDIVVAIGDSASTVIDGFAKCTDTPAPALDNQPLAKGEALVWIRNSKQVKRVKLIQSKAVHKRHQRKYAMGELGEDNSFYFRGPQKKLNLRAQNLITFLQMADGVDDETWLFHLKCHDYSTWFRDKIKDPALADEAAQTEKLDSKDAKTSREKIKDAIERRYTAPA